MSWHSLYTAHSPHIVFSLYSNSPSPFLTSSTLGADFFASGCSSSSCSSSSWYSYFFTWERSYSWNLFGIGLLDQRRQQAEDLASKMAFPFSSSPYQPYQGLSFHSQEEHQHSMPKQPGMSASAGVAARASPEQRNPCPTIEIWTSSSAMPVTAAMVSYQYQHPDYANPWALPTSEPYASGPSSLSSRPLSPTSSYAFHLPDSQSTEFDPSVAPYANPTDLHDFGDRKSSLDWVCVDSKVSDFDANLFWTLKTVASDYQQSEQSASISTMTHSPSSPASCASSAWYEGTMPAQPFVGIGEQSATFGDTEEESNSDQPYSLLIYQALGSAKDRKMPLQEIYRWFEKNTEKGKDQTSKGWQNSIRHNLSMNAVRLPHFIGHGLF